MWISASRRLCYQTVCQRSVDLWIRHHLPPPVPSLRRFTLTHPIPSGAAPPDSASGGSNPASLNPAPRSSYASADPVSSAASLPPAARTPEEKRADHKLKKLAKREVRQQKRQDRHARMFAAHVAEKQKRKDEELAKRRRTELGLEPESPINMPRRNYKFPQRPTLKEDDLEETFVLGSGPGGQAINKRHISVSLIHKPTGIRVQCHSQRSRNFNRKEARRRLSEKLEEFYTPGQTRKDVKRERERARKATKVRQRNRKKAESMFEEAEKESAARSAAQERERRRQTEGTKTNEGQVPVFGFSLLKQEIKLEEAEGER